MAIRRFPRPRLILLATATILGVVALALPLSVQAGVAEVGAIPVSSPAPEPAIVEERFAFADSPAPVQSPAPEVPSEPAPPPPPEPEPDACADALTWVEGAGLDLPDGVEYHCPSTQFAHHGAACWNGSPCRGSGFIAINMDLMQGTGTDYLRHVVAHEVCHIIDFQTTGRSTEAGADACAAAHGAP